MPTIQFNLQFNCAAGLWPHIFEQEVNLEKPLEKQIRDVLLGLNSASVKLFTATYNNTMLVNIDNVNEEFV